MVFRSSDPAGTLERIGKMDTAELATLAKQMKVEATAAALTRALGVEAEQMAVLVAARKEYEGKMVPVVVHWVGSASLIAGSTIEAGHPCTLSVRGGGVSGSFSVRADAKGCCSDVLLWLPCRGGAAVRNTFELRAGKEHADNEEIFVLSLEQLLIERVLGVRSGGHFVVGSTRTGHGPYEDIRTDATGRLLAFLVGDQLPPLPLADPSLAVSYKVCAYAAGLRSFAMSSVDPYVTLTRAPSLQGESEAVAVLRSQTILNCRDDELAIGAPMLLPYGDSFVPRTCSDTVLTLALHDYEVFRKDQLLGTAELPWAELAAALERASEDTPSTLTLPLQCQKKMSAKEAALVRAEVSLKIWKVPALLACEPIVDAAAKTVELLPPPEVPEVPQHFARDPDGFNPDRIYDAMNVLLDRISVLEEKVEVLARQVNAQPSPS